MKAGRKFYCNDPCRRKSGFHHAGSVCLLKILLIGRALIIRSYEEAV